MQNVTTMNYHFKITTKPPPPPQKKPPDLIPQPSPDHILTQSSSQTVRYITSHIRRKEGNVNLIEPQILATHQGLIQYKDCVIISSIDRHITHIPDQTTRFA